MVQHRIHRVLFYASPMALIAAGIINAQTYTLDTWPNRGPIWRQLDPGDSLNWNAGRGYAGFHGQSMVGSRVPIYPTVTVHELAHRVPARATKEYRRALKAQERGNDYEAVSHYKRAISLDPEFLMAINDLGTTYLRLSKINLAIEQFSTAITVDPRAARPLTWQLLIFYRINMEMLSGSLGEQSTSIVLAHTACSS
jgi:tetratricopeptide (TPR) repeat protein